MKFVFFEQDANCKDPDNDLIYAAFYGNKTWVELLLTCDDVDINTGIHLEGITPLYIACKFGHLSLVQVLLEQTQNDINKGYKDVLKLLSISMVLFCECS